MRALSIGAVLALALLGGCKKKTTTAAKTADAAVAAVVVDAAVAAVVVDAADGDAEGPPLTPPVADGKPGIQVKGVEYEGHEVKMLPAIREDGAQIAAVTFGDDGGRGYLDMRLQLLDTKTGKITDDRVLVDADETSKAQGEDGAFAPAMLDTVKKRIGDANALLAAATWRALEPSTAPEDEPEAPITAAGISWSLDEKLKLVGKRGDKVVFEKTYTQLTGKKAPKATNPDDEEGMCPDIVVLEGIHVDTKSGHALIEFGRQSGHNCGAPGADLAVIALPK